MSWSLEEIRAAVGRNLSWLDDDFRVYEYMPGQLQPPCVVLTTGEPLVNRDMAMNRGLAQISLRLVVLVPAADVERAQRQLDELVNSIPTALLSDRSLSEQGDLTVGDVDGYDEFEVAGASYMGAGITLTVLVDDRP